MDIIEMLLTPNPYSRPGIGLKRVTKIVVHYVGNAGSSAANNRDYFEGLGKSGLTYSSSHYIVGLNGEIIRCVPENEIAYASNDANACSISIETCHPDATGKFKDVTYNSLIWLCADICRRYQLNPISDIIRHYDVTGKLCPLWYVKNPAEWEKLKKDVKAMGETPKQEVKTAGEAVKVLAEKGIMNTPDYWLNASTCVKYLDTLLINIANKL